jgi:pimeloyl-ACP methyl ester carboxylesterase
VHDLVSAHDVAREAIRVEQRMGPDDCQQTAAGGPTFGKAPSRGHRRAIMAIEDRNGDDVFVLAPDGLRLHVRRFGPHDGQRPPVVCLPGLARTTLDFDTLAMALANDPERPRDVLTIDYRGRGESEYDRDPANYTVATEIGDLLAVLAALALDRAVFIGTSRGGILAMVLATVRPSAIAGVILNDIGPVIETNGLLRIKGYLARMPQPKNIDDAADNLRRVFAADFPKLDANDWMLWARRTFKDENGVLTLRYDPKLAGVLDGVDAQRPQPTLWKQFDALAPFPLMVIRGANSDLLSAETVEAMHAKRPHMLTLVVPDQGHAPLLSEADVIARIAAFVDTCR